MGRALQASISVATRDVQGDYGADRAAIAETTVALAVVLFVLSAVDLAATEVSVMGLGAVEQNPLVAPILGTTWAFVVKLGIPAAVVLTAPLAATPRVARVLKFVVVVYAAAVTFNVTQLLALAFLF